jgi:hypothetical protein
MQPEPRQQRQEARLPNDRPVPQHTGHFALPMTTSPVPSQRGQSCSVARRCFPVPLHKRQSIISPGLGCFIRFFSGTELANIA